MKELVGKEIYGFRFEKLSLHYSPAMDIHIGEIGIIESLDNEICNVRFKNGELWTYPYSQIFNHLVDERTVDELLIEMKQLILKLWKTKI